jgi:hypothetical protein
MKTKLVILSFIFSAAVFGQPSKFEDPLFDRMTGQWVLTGTIAGQQTTHDVSVEWILAHQYVQLREVSREKDSTGHAAYEAFVLFGIDSVADGYVCLWLDITSGAGLRGQLFGHAQKSGDTLPFLFKAGDGSVFHTTFIYDKSKDTWQWKMDGEEHGTLQPFARVELQRKK